MRAKVLAGMPKSFSTFILLIFSNWSAGTTLAMPIIWRRMSAPRACSHCLALWALPSGCTSASASANTRSETKGSPRSSQRFQSSVKACRLSSVCRPADTLMTSGH
ncbi:hypothetical protein D9M69_703140 [compost metagenome]